MSRTKRILILGVESHYGHGVAMGVNRYGQAHGDWEFRLGRDNSSESVCQAEVAIKQWKADGVIAFVQSDRVERFIRRCGVPAINVTGGRELDLPTVLQDNVAVGRMAAEYFLNNGFRNFAFCARTSEVSSLRRLEGFSQRVAEANFKCSVFSQQFGGWRDENWAQNRQRMKRWLLSLKTPVALMAVYDPLATEVIWACRHMNLRIPDDVAVIGTGNEELHCQMSTPRLSSVESDLDQIGYEAARLLDRLIAGAKPPRKPILIPPKGVIVRQSSDIVAIEDPEVAAAVRFIRDRGCQPISVKDILGEVPLSRSTLERRFEKLVGRFPGAELRRVRMENAFRLLKETELPIAGVAQNSGFGGAVTFSAYFRRATGTTPTAYRRKSRIEKTSARAHPT